MTIRISLTLSDRDLRYFRDAVRQARDAVSDADEEEIVGAIRDVVRDIRNQGPLPDFIARRMPELELLTDMLDDSDWKLPVRERERLLATFIYFCDPEDLIPDDIPGIGFLDDVIMIELLLRELRHVADAYRDFCAFRERLNAEFDAATRQDRLQRRRTELRARMRRRYASDRERGINTTLW